VIQERDTSVQNFLVNSKLLETIKAKDGELFHLEYHQRRVEASLENASVSLEEILKAPRSGLYRCRVVYDLNGYEVSYHPYIKRSIKSLKLVYDDEIEYSKKYADRSSLDALYEKKLDCDDVLIVKDGLITDTTIANIAFKYNNQWITPKQPLLYGTTRARLLESKVLIEKDIRVDELSSFSEVALMNAMIDFDIIPLKNVEEIIC